MSLVVLGSWVLYRHQRQHPRQRQHLVLSYSNGLQPYLSYFPGLGLKSYSLFEVLAGYGRGPRAPVAPARVVATVSSSIPSAGYGRGPRAPVSPALVVATMHSLTSMSISPSQRLSSGLSLVSRPASMIFLMSTTVLPPQQGHQGSPLVQRPSTAYCLMSTLLLPPQRLHQGSSLVRRPCSPRSRRSYSYVYNKPLLQASLSVGRWTPEFHRSSQCRAYYVPASHFGK